MNEYRYTYNNGANDVNLMLKYAYHDSFTDKYFDSDCRLINGIIYYFDKKMIVQNGIIHNDDGPAITYRDSGATAYYLHGKIIGANLSKKTFEKEKELFYKRMVFQ